MKRWMTALVVSVFSVGFGVSGVFAGDVIVNGSFDTGDYFGWNLYEGPPANGGTWGIVEYGQTINPSAQVIDVEGGNNPDPDHFLYDWCDRIYLSQISDGLPITYEPSSGNFMAAQLQYQGQEHRMFQDIDLPENAKALSWDMFYDNHAPGGAFGINQLLAVHVRNLEDNIIDTLFLTDDGEPASIPMQNFNFDISDHAGKTVRIDVQLLVYVGFLDAGFDNFRVELAEEDAGLTVPSPPGWSKGTGKTFDWWAKHEGKEIPLGFSKGKKKGWNK